MSDSGTDYREVIDDVVAARARAGGESIVYGICGSQGSGKSTLTKTLKSELHAKHGLSVAVLSLDDLYLSREERERLAREVHPLLRTRGVPGTHDVDLGVDVIQSLKRAQPGEVTSLPRFDKSVDDPFPRDQWEHFQGHADVVIFEGWCVGTVAQRPEELVQPINALERESDPDGTWRRYVNDQLGGRYRALFGLLDRLLVLCAPGFEVVFEWRRQQERELAAKTRPGLNNDKRKRIMNDEELARFIMHYERLTRHTLAEMPGRADVVIRLDAQRAILSINER